MVAVIVAVSEPEIHAFLSAPNGKRGTSDLYYSAFGESVKQSSQNLALCNTTM